MQANTKEFQDLQNQFEKDLSTMPVYIGAKIERNPDRNNSSYFYNNDKINTLFIGYMTGYSFAKSKAILGEFEQ